MTRYNYKWIPRETDYCSTCGGKASTQTSQGPNIHKEPLQLHNTATQKDSLAVLQQAHRRHVHYPHYQSHTYSASANKIPRHSKDPTKGAEEEGV